MRSTSETEQADDQRHRDQADPEIAAEHQDVEPDIGADHVERAVGEVDHGQHAEDQRKADREQHVDRAQREAGKQLQRDQIETETGHALSPAGDARPRRGTPRLRRQALWPELLAGAQVLLIGLVGADDLEDIGFIAHILRLRLDHQYRLHRLMVAFAIILRSLVEVVFQRFQRRDDLVGVDAARILDGGEHGADAAIAERAIVGRQLAVIHLAEGAVERLGRGEFVLDAPNRTNIRRPRRRRPAGPPRPGSHGKAAAR